MAKCNRTSDSISHRDKPVAEYLAATATQTQAPAKIAMYMTCRFQWKQSAHQTVRYS